MRYNDIFTNLILIILMIVLLLVTFIKSHIDIIVAGYIKDNDINVTLNIKYLFNLINIKIPVYPKKNKSTKKSDNAKRYKVKNKKSKRKINLRAIDKSLIINILTLIKETKVHDIYSNIKFGNENIEFTCFIYVFINIIYSNLINLVDSEKIYLNVEPSFTENYILSDFKIHIRPTVKQIISIAIGGIKIRRKINTKEGGNNEISKSNTKPYGKNI